MAKKLAFGTESISLPSGRKTRRILEDGDGIEGSKFQHPLTSDEHKLVAAIVAEGITSRMLRVVQYKVAVDEVDVTLGKHEQATYDRFAARDARNGTSLAEAYKANCEGVKRLRAMAHKELS